MAAKRRLVSGDRPTGRLHLGHYVGSLENRLALQEDYDCFFLVADYQALTDNLYRASELNETIREVVLDWLAVGIDPDRATLFVQSQVPQLAELTILFSMMVTVSRLRRNPTIKEEAKDWGLDNAVMSYGFLGYPVSQAADILLFRAECVPVGEDQLPHLEQTREIARTFNRIYGETFPEPEGVVGRCPRLMGTDGRKMGKSLDNAIALSDPSEVVGEKIAAMVTDPARVRATDPGHPEVCACCAYHEVFSGDRIEEIKEACRAGRRGCVECKGLLAETVNALLDPVRERRAAAESKPDLVAEVLAAGAARARAVGEETMARVREQMHMAYQW
jgi:tryptophanyl-tRNA synthetase